MSDKTIITYADTALPTTGAAVTLFNSVTAFPPGGCFHLLSQNWFQYGVFFDGATGSVTGVVTGAYSQDKGVTWTTFYTSATFDDDVNNRDEVFVGQFRDIRFQFTTGNENTTVFRPHITLSRDKASSKAAPTDVL
jgi:hypothetical protein